MGQLPNKYHILDDGSVYKVNEDGSFTSVGNVEEFSHPKTIKPKATLIQSTDIAFPKEIRFQASLQGFINSKGGKLHIYPETFSFKPHFLNFGSRKEQIWNIADIIGYSRHSATLEITVYTVTEALRFGVWKISTIIAELENRRRAYYTNRGLMIPQLEVV